MLLTILTEIKKVRRRHEQHITQAMIWVLLVKTSVPTIKKATNQSVGPASAGDTIALRTLGNTIIRSLCLHLTTVGSEPFEVADMKPINWLLMYSNMTKDLGSSKFHVGRFDRIKVMITCCAP